MVKIVLGVHFFPQKKIVFFFLMLFSSYLLGASLEHITIRDYDFSIVTEKYDIYDSKGEVMKLYREERNNDLRFVFSFILKDATGTCSDKSMQQGSYTVNGNMIVLYTLWSEKAGYMTRPTERR